MLKKVAQTVGISAGSLLLGITACSSSPKHTSENFTDGKFHNSHSISMTGWSDALPLMRAYMFEGHKDKSPTAEIPVETVTRKQLELLADNSLIRLGHSTLLFKINGHFWLTDPVFSERASPVQWAGPKRFHAPPINIKDLPPITGIILSHDHYDHLDEAAISQLADKTQHFITPLGVGDRLIQWGVDSSKIIQQDWWQSIRINGVELITTPSQHFSGRGLNDRDSTLWASWVIRTEQINVFFSGDSGYFDGFKTIGERFGPFDLTLVETGAYHELWSDIHMTPEQSVQAHIDLRGRAMMPIHNGTFDLALHAWYDPLERVTTAADSGKVELVTPKMGEPLALNQAQNSNRWWREFMAEQR